MIRVTVELDSAITGKTTRLAELRISNDGTEKRWSHGNYDVRLMTKKGRISRRGRVESYPRLSLSVWKLVLRALKSVGHGTEQS